MTLYIIYYVRSNFFALKWLYNKVYEILAKHFLIHFLFLGSLIKTYHPIYLSSFLRSLKQL